MKHKNGLRVIALTLIMSMLMSFQVLAVNESNADRLYDLGLFKGTGSGYALDQTATRMQGLIMLTRLLGEEEAALASTAPCPFTDVAAGNPSRYAAYAYEKGYTTGTTATTFTPAATIGFKHYVTFLLRALGYDDKAGDFTFATSLTKAAEIGMMDAESAAYISQNNPTFYRADLVDLCLSALTMKLKNGGGTLAEQLVQRGVFTRSNGVKQGVISAGRKTYTYQPHDFSTVTRTNATYALPSGKLSADVITVNLSNPSVSVRSAMVDHRLGATANFSDIVAASGAEVVINGNFFEAYNESKFPIGHVMVDGQFLYGVSGISAVGFTEDNEMRVGRPAVFFYVKSGSRTWACYELNSRTQHPSTSVLYTPAFGESVSFSCDGIATAIENGKIVSSEAVAAGGSAAIPQNGYLMFFGTGFASTNYYRAPVVGTSATLTPELTQKDANGFTLDDIVSLVSGAPRLVEGGVICETLEPGFQEARFTTAVTPRTAIGKLQNGNMVIVSTSAASVQQMRELMLQLGCVDAVNLDGGGSTALAYQGKILRSPGRQLTTTLQIFVNKG